MPSVLRHPRQREILRHPSDDWLRHTNPSGKKHQSRSFALQRGPGFQQRIVCQHHRQRQDRRQHQHFPFLSPSPSKRSRVPQFLPANQSQYGHQDINTIVCVRIRQRCQQGKPSVDQRKFQDINSFPAPFFPSHLFKPYPGTGPRWRLWRRLVRPVFCWCRSLCQPRSR